MKRIRFLFFLVCIGSFFILNSCNESGDPVPDFLVVVDRADGRIYKLNTKTGEKYVTKQITLNGDSLPHIRGMVYNKTDDKIYVTARTTGDGKLFSIDTKTFSATAINENSNDEWYGLPDIKITSDNKLICTTWHKPAGAGYGPGLIIFNLNGTVKEADLFTTDDPNGINMCCGFGMTFSNTDKELLIASSGNGLEMYSSDLNAEVVLKSTLKLEGFDESTDEDDYAIKNITKYLDKYYALVYSTLDNSTILAELDLINDKLIQIAVLSEDGSQYFHGLSVIPAILLSSN